MINIIWFLLILGSIVAAIINNCLPQMTKGVLDGITNSVEFILKLAGTMCFWNGVLNIAQQSGLTKVLGKMLSPILKLIFPNLSKDSKALEFITLNVSANFLGLGNAATPIGLKAMEELDRHNPQKGRATDEMIAFVVMNTACITLLPTTVAMIRDAAGSKSPMEILPCVIGVSFLSLLTGLLAVKCVGMWKRGHGDG